MDTPASIYQAAETHGVEIRAHNVIYKMFDDLKEEMTERLPPKIEEDILGMHYAWDTHSMYSMRM